MRTKQITKYIAMDGKEFDCKNDCENYENIFVSNLNDQLVVFNKYDDDIDLLDDNLPYIANTIICRTKKAYEYIDKIFDEEGMAFVDFDVKNFPCSFIYDKDNEQWTRIKDMISDLTNHIEQLNKFIALEEN